MVDLKREFRRPNIENGRKQRRGQAFCGRTHRGERP